MTAEGFDEVTAAFREELTPLYREAGISLDPIRMDVMPEIPSAYSIHFGPRTDNVREMRTCRDKLISVDLSPHALFGLEADVLLFSLCHEAGHHFGGAPYKPRICDGRGFTSGEGQADYWAANVCLDRFRGRLAMPKSEVDLRILRSQCLKMGGKSATMDDIDRCILAGWEFFRLMQFHSRVEFGVDVPVNDFSDFKRLLYGHAPPVESGHIETEHASDRCRLETTMAGALGLPRPVCWYRP